MAKRFLRGHAGLRIADYKFGNEVLAHWGNIVPRRVLKVEGVLTANVALNPASLKIAPGSEERVTIRYLTRLRNQ